MTSPTLTPGAVNVRRGRPSLRETNARRAMLLEVAREQFATHGYRAVTMEQVATSAGVTKRTIYAWHHDKEALFQACIEVGSVRLGSSELNAELSLGQALRAYVISLISVLGEGENMRIAALLMQERREFPRLGRIARDALRDYVVAPLAEYLGHQGVPPAQQEAVAEIFLGSALAPIVKAVVLGERLPSKEAVRNHADIAVKMFVHGLKSGGCPDF